MTDLEPTIAKIRELLPKVYEGVWSVEEFQRDGETWGNIVDADGTIIAEIRGALEFCGNGENAAYIALLNPATVASLLDKLESARREALEEAAKLIEDGYPRPGISSKTDKCPHDKFKWEECDECSAWAIRKLAAQSSPPPQSHVVGGEPVAWRKDFADEFHKYPPEFCDDAQLAQMWRDHPSGFTVTPLYAQPAPAEQVVWNQEIIDFLYKHGDLTYSAAARAVQLLAGNGYGFTSSSEGRQDNLLRLRKALRKIADMIDAEDADLDDAISIASTALAAATEGSGE